MSSIIYTEIFLIFSTFPIYKLWARGRVYLTECMASYKNENHMLKGLFDKSKVSIILIIIPKLRLPIMPTSKVNAI